MRRSELVTVPSFSPQAAAGSSTWAKRVVSVLRGDIGDDDEGAVFSAPRATKSASGRLSTGLVAMIHSALIAPVVRRPGTVRPP